MPAERVWREPRGLTKSYRKYLRSMGTKHPVFPELGQLAADFGFRNYRIFIGCPPHWQPTMAQSHFGTGLEGGGSRAGTDHEASRATIHAPDGEGNLVCPSKSLCSLHPRWQQPVS